MSEFDRRTGVKHLRVRGMKAVRFAAIMKTIGLNILRASRHRGGNDPRGPHRGFLWLLLAGWSLFKELVRQRSRKNRCDAPSFLTFGLNQAEMAVEVFTSPSSLLKPKGTHRLC